jgi:predicted amidohydrolase
MNKYDYITPIKEQLDRHMMTHCAMFVTIGNGSAESPRWYNFRGYDDETKQLTIGSTQKSSLFFTVDCEGLDMGFIICDEFWSQFKEYRTEFLKNNFKTIDRI